MASGVVLGVCAGAWSDTGSPRPVLRLTHGGGVCVRHARRRWSRWKQRDRAFLAESGSFPFGAPLGLCSQALANLTLSPLLLT